MKSMTAALACLALPAIATAQGLPESFTTGPVIEGYGPSAPVDADLNIPNYFELKVAFDISEASEAGEINRQFESVARFLNMHVADGVPRIALKPAIVVHGPAAMELLRPADGEARATTPLIEALMAEDVPIYLCGQTAAARGIAKEDLIPGVQMALSAMTAHAVLAHRGYSLNPF